MNKSTVNLLELSDSQKTQVFGTSESLPATASRRREILQVYFTVKFRER